MFQAAETVASQELDEITVPKSNSCAALG